MLWKDSISILFGKDKYTFIGWFGAILVIDGREVILEAGGNGMVLQICGFVTEIISVCVKNNDYFLLFDARSPVSPKPNTKRAWRKHQDVDFTPCIVSWQHDRVFCSTLSRV